MHIYLTHLTVCSSTPLLSPLTGPQALKNLVYLARVLHRSYPRGLCPESHHGRYGDAEATETHEGVSDEEAGEEEGVTTTAISVAKTKKPRDLLWLVQKMCRIARMEAGHSPKEPHKVPPMHMLHLATCGILNKNFL